MRLNNKGWRIDYFLVPEKVINWVKKSDLANRVDLSKVVVCGFSMGGVEAERKRFVGLCSGKKYQEESDDEVAGMNTTISSKINAGTMAATCAKTLK